MTGVLAAPAPPPIENTWAAPAIAFAVAIAIGVVVFVLANAARGRIRNPDDFLLAGRRVGAGQNALAMVGGTIMYSTVIIITGHVALNGFDAILLLTAFTMSTVVGVLIYAGPVRNVGGHTLGDVFALRARERPARMASAVLTLIVFGMFTIIAVGSVAFVANRMFSTSSTVNAPLVAGITAVVGLVAIAWVYLGGMEGVTKVLVLKVVLMGGLVAVLTAVVLARYKLNLVELLNDAEANAAPDKRGLDLLTTGRLFEPGSTYGSDQDPWVHLSKVFSIAVGALGMPFLFMRYFVTPNGREARRSAGWASIITVLFWTCMIILGLGAVAILGGDAIGLVGAHRDITLPKIADEIGGGWATGALGGIALMATGAIFATLLLNGVTSITKDVNAVRGRKLDPATELKSIRRNVLIVGIASLVGGLVMLTQLTHIFIPTSIDLGAACVLPAVVYSLFWRRYNTRGLQWTVYGGLAVTLLMVVFSNGVSGDPTALFPDADFKFVDFEPGLLGAPLGFLFGYLGSVTSKERDDARFAEAQVRALTGAVVPAGRDLPARGTDERGGDSRLVSETN
ncbi:solute symporter family protein [Micromonospora sagamiensis]|uniref:Cation/acetate symporter n=1 Tax=Micromonospora sagamiensis TaxID=47875 RepID=A0A562WBM0_9ACTN|nr:Na+:solute symporter [Micromonospora sagamiensis]TWJ27673.1 cation/acetate symporter [Micromonospora sagamiensis]BCL13441.1 cation acetate symporter [Micromonospora sagamiensis]